MKDKSGYTIVELMVVVAVVSVLLAAAIPLYVSYKRTACDRAAERDLIGLLAAWEKFGEDALNLAHETPFDLKDLAGEFYGWQGTSTKCQVVMSYDRTTRKVSSSSLKGSRPYGSGTRWKYEILMPVTHKSVSADQTDAGKESWSLKKLFSPNPAYAMSSLTKAVVSQAEAKSKKKNESQKTSEPPPAKQSKKQEQTRRKADQEAVKQTKKEERAKGRAERVAARQARREERARRRAERAAARQAAREERARRRAEQAAARQAGNQNPPNNSPDGPSTSSDTHSGGNASGTSNSAVEPRPEDPGNVGPNALAGTFRGSIHVSVATQDELSGWLAYPRGIGCQGSAFDASDYRYRGCSSN